MLGHTLAGTVPADPTGLTTTVFMLLERQLLRPCSAESHPTKSTMPPMPAEHVGSIVSRQRRNAKAREEQDGVTETTFEQLVTQSPVPKEHPEWAILPQVVEQDAATWV
jgi:hypothetical protein